MDMLASADVLEAELPITRPSAQTKSPPEMDAEHELSHATRRAHVMENENGLDDKESATWWTRWCLREDRKKR